MSAVRKYFLKLFIAAFALVVIRRVWGFAPDLRFHFVGMALAFLVLAAFPWPGKPIFWLWNLYKSRIEQGMRFFQGAGLLLMVIALYRTWKVGQVPLDEVSDFLLMGGGVAFFLLGLIRPAATFLFDLWMKLAHLIQAVVSRIILTLVYIMAVLPVSLIAKLSGKHFLIRYPDRTLSSYWLDRPPAPEKARYRKHF